MTSPLNDPTERKAPADEVDHDDLDRAIRLMAQRAEYVEAYAEALLDDKDGELDLPAATLAESIGSDATWDQLIASLEEAATSGGASADDVFDLRHRLSPDLLARYDSWLNSRPLPWTRADVVSVGVALVLGAAFQAIDDTLDSAVLQGLGWLRQTEVVRNWEKLGKRLPIDYTGVKFGGPDHRQRSPGHDVARLLEGMRQIRGGYFQGTYWVDGVKQSFTTAPGAYEPVDDPVEALTKLLAHLGADFVTPLSLPLPGWTLIGELPERQVRVFASDLYRAGFNTRSGALVPGLGVVLVEVLIRSHLALQSFASRGSLLLQPQEKAKANEMLLVAQSGLAAASASVAAARALTGEGALALRHLNAPAFARAGVAAVVVMTNRAQVRRYEPTSWLALAEAAINANHRQEVPDSVDTLRYGEATTEGG